MCVLRVQVLKQYLKQIEVTDVYFKVLGLKIDRNLISILLGTLFTSGFTVLARVFTDYDLHA